MLTDSMSLVKCNGCHCQIAATFDPSCLLPGKKLILCYCGSFALSTDACPSSFKASKAYLALHGSSLNTKEIQDTFAILGIRWLANFVDT